MSFNKDNPTKYFLKNATNVNSELLTNVNSEL